MTRAGRLLPALVVMCAIALPAPLEAQAASPAAIHNDCSDNGKLDRQYSNADLRRARDTIPADLDEYSDCRDVITSAIAAGPGPDNSGGAGNGTGSGTGSVPDTPVDPADAAADQAELDSITGEDAEQPSVVIGGQTVEPGANGLFDLATAENGLPGPLIAALLALLLLTGGAAYLALRDRRPDLSRVPLLNQIDALRGKHV